MIPKQPISRCSRSITSSQSKSAHVLTQLLEGVSFVGHNFVFAALKMAIDDHDPWARNALALYARSARSTRALCDGLAAFKIAGSLSECRH